MGDSGKKNKVPKQKTQEAAKGNSAPLVSPDSWKRKNGLNFDGSTTAQDNRPGIGNNSASRYGGGNDDISEARRKTGDVAEQYGIYGADEGRNDRIGSGTEKSKTSYLGPPSRKVPKRDPFKKKGK